MQKIYSGKISPIFKEKLDRNLFLSFDHYMRYKFMFRLKKHFVTSMIFVDPPYLYFAQEHDYGTLIVGTDDSGKLFSRHADPLVWHDDDIKDSHSFRKAFFDFDFHWWERDSILGRLDKYYTTDVRVQGDLVLGIRKITPKDIDVLVNFPGFVEFVRRLARKWKDKRTYVTFSDIVHPMYADEIPLVPRRWHNEKYAEEFFLNFNQYRIVWNRHVICFSGHKLDNLNYLVVNGVIKVKHPEHGVRLFNLGIPIIITFG